MHLLNKGGRTTIMVDKCGRARTMHLLNKGGRTTIMVDKCDRARIKNQGN